MGSGWLTPWGQGTPSRAPSALGVEGSSGHGHTELMGGRASQWPGEPGQPGHHLPAEERGQWTPAQDGALQPTGHCTAVPQPTGHCAATPQPTGHRAATPQPAGHRAATSPVSIEGGFIIPGRAQRLLGVDGQGGADALVGALQRLVVGGEDVEGAGHTGGREVGQVLAALLLLLQLALVAVAPRAPALRAAGDGRGDTAHHALPVGNSASLNIRLEFGTLERSATIRQSFGLPFF